MEWAGRMQQRMLRGWWWVAGTALGPVPQRCCHGVGDGRRRRRGPGMMGWSLIAWVAGATALGAKGWVGPLGRRAGSVGASCHRSVEHGRVAGGGLRPEAVEVGWMGGGRVVGGTAWRRRRPRVGGRLSVGRGLDEAARHRGGPAAAGRVEGSVPQVPCRGGGRQEARRVGACGGTCGGGGARRIRGGAGRWEGAGRSRGVLRVASGPSGQPQPVPTGAARDDSAGPGPARPPRRAGLPHA